MIQFNRFRILNGHPTRELMTVKYTACDDKPATHPLPGLQDHQPFPGPAPGEFDEEVLDDVFGVRSLRVTLAFDPVVQVTDWYLSALYEEFDGIADVEILLDEPAPGTVRAWARLHLEDGTFEDRITYFP
jgi:hypothetical protein